MNKYRFKVWKITGRFENGRRSSGTGYDGLTIYAPNLNTAKILTSILSMHWIGKWCKPTDVYFDEGITLVKYCLFDKEVQLYTVAENVQMPTLKESFLKWLNYPKGD